MQDLSTHAWVLAAAGAAALTIGVPSRNGEPVAHGDPVKLAAPKRLAAGDALLGAGRLYPSPAVRDMNGDGHLDIVIGDLPGRVTVAYGKGDGTLGAEEDMLRADGQPLKFHNW